MEWNPYVISVQKDLSFYLYSTITNTTLKTKFRRRGVLNIKKNSELYRKLVNKEFIINKHNQDSQFQQILTQKANLYTDYTYVIAPSLSCNFSCSYCFEDLNGTRLTDTRAKILTKHISTTYDSQKMYGKALPIFINWYGGEPLLSLKTIDLIHRELLKNNVEFNTQVTTNGYKLEHLNIGRVKDWNIKKVQVTLDGSPENHNKFRKTKANNETFYSILNSAKQFALLNPSTSVVLRFNVHPEDTSEILNLTNNISMAEIAQIENIEVYFSSIDSSNINEVKKQTFNLDKLYTTFIDAGFSVASKGKLSLNMCSCTAISNRAFHVGPELELYGCYSEFGHQSKVIGFINSEKIMSYENTYTTEAIYPDKCKTCEIFAICSAGGCPYKTINNLVNLDDDYCSNQKNRASIALKQFYNLSP